MQITVYTTPSCPQCEMTKRVLTRGEVEFDVVDVSKDAKAMDYIKNELGYSAAPVVVVDDRQHWSGFRNEYLKSVITAVHRQEAADQPVVMAEKEPVAA